MYRVDIFTDVGVYTALLDENTAPGTDLSDYAKTQPNSADVSGHALYVVKKAIRDSFSLYGWTPFDNPANTPPAAFMIGEGSEIKHLRAYTNADATPTPGHTNADAPEPAIRATVGASVSTWKSEYLGQEIRLTLVEWVKADGYALVLPLHINGQPAITQLKPAALTQQVQLIKSENGVNPADYEIVVPDVPLNQEEAVEYLKDYADEKVTRLSGDGKARPWFGYKEGQVEEHGNT